MFAVCVSSALENGASITRGYGSEERLNPSSWEVKKGFVEASLKDSKVGSHYQFVRNGYYCTDKDSTSDNLVFNRTCGLKSSFNPNK